MNLQQLIELSILDAMGLLDEDEQFRFEAAFRAASPAVQAIPSRCRPRTGSRYPCPRGSSTRASIRSPLPSERKSR